MDCFVKIAAVLRLQVFGFPGFKRDVLVNKSKEKFLAKIPYPHFFLFYLIVKRDYPAVPVEGDIEQPFDYSGFTHFAAGQEGSALGFFLFDIVDPFKEIPQFFFSSSEQLRFTDSFF